MTYTRQELKNMVKEGKMSIDIAIDYAHTIGISDALDRMNNECY